MSVLVPDPATTDWVPLWSLGGQGAMTLIEEKVLGAPQATLDFTNIPATYKDLRLVLVGRSDFAGLSTTLRVRLNGDAGANYDTQTFQSNAAAVAGTETLGGTEVQGLVTGNNAPAGVASHTIAEFPGYAGTVFNKTLIAESFLKQGVAAGNLWVQRRIASWRNSAAINRIELSLSAGNFMAGTRVALYGIGDAVPTPQSTTPALQLIQEAILGVDGVIDFTSIPQTFKSLMMITELRGVQAVAEVPVSVRVNGDNGASYSYWGFGSAASGAVASLGTYGPAAPSTPRVFNAPGDSVLANSFGVGQILFPGYAGSTPKTWKGDGGTVVPSSAAAFHSISNRWSGTAGINRIELLATAGGATTWKAGSHATLYGLG